MGYQSATMGAFHSVSRSLLAIQGLKRLDRGEDERAKAMKRAETLRKDYRAQNELAKKYRESGKIEKAKAAAARRWGSPWHWLPCWNYPHCFYLVI